MCEHLLRQGRGEGGKSGPWRSFHPIEFIALNSAPTVTLALLSGHPSAPQDASRLCGSSVDGQVAAAKVPTPKVA